MSSQPKFYNCSNCPAYCCSYPHIPVSEADLQRLARHFELDVEEARSRYTKRGDDATPMVMRHKADENFGTACQFLDRETRRCTIYKARPGTCRAYPGTVRCGYYDFLSFERSIQEDETFVAKAYNP
ncbi:MAG: YkgJ family cysteine cluster protein [Acidobacteriota bacterium]